MAAAQPIMRLVRDDDPPRPELTVSQEDPVEQIDSMRKEIDLLNLELSQLRRRGDMLDYHMSRLDEELRLAARLQQDFLPKTLPKLGPIEFQTLFRPAGHVSGDFYDVIRLDESHIGFYIADAVGHGVPAALLTMFIKHALVTKQITDGGYRLLGAAETLTRLNSTLIDQDLSAATFATAIYGTIDTRSLKITFSRGGHPHPILLRGDGTIEHLECDGGLLGVFPEETFAEKSFQLMPGDRLLLYTDGIEVAFGEDIEANQARWFEELYKMRKLPARELLTNFAQVLDAQPEARRKDDLTMVVMEVRE